MATKKKVVAAKKTGTGKVTVKVKVEKKAAPPRRATAPKVPMVPAVDDTPFTGEELKQFEQFILLRLKESGAEMEHLSETVLNTTPRDASGDLSAYSFHMADLGTDAMEREMAFQRAAMEGDQIMELREALQRLHRGDYGICEGCGGRIARPRLEALPEARLCIKCKEQEERRKRMRVE